MYGKGSWALVTGASDGIGAEFCKQLASKGFNICLVSRTLSKLKDVESAIKSQNPTIKTRIIEADFFGNTQMAFFRNLKAQTADLDIGLLVVCAGFKRADWFERIPSESLQRMLDLNVYHFIATLKHFLPALLKRPKSGVIIVSSMNDRLVVPVNTTYGATKVTSSYLGFALQQELPANVDLQVFTPSYCRTSFNQSERIPRALSITG
jgi:17beta-estradiol 17-dehydrogenase / very-long-chain 3-oxoacyl-CoA reductase